MILYICLTQKTDGAGLNIWSGRLTEQQRKTIEDTADMISQHLPFYSPKPLNTKKPVEKEIEVSKNDDTKGLRASENCCITF